MDYIRANESNVKAITELALLLWSDHSFEDLFSEFQDLIKNDNSAIFLCFDNNIEIGFAQFSLRGDYVEGTNNSPVGYLEGIYVKEQYRKRGISKEFICMGEVWAKEKGCSQIASDCELTNTDSLYFHLNCGFLEANRIICFVKDIG